ncbi:2'-5' RNA ligase family protein [Vogesella facilis]|uniref:2'-5' RNA ligase family protein n=1 Tax=Vogesella facilis TaxID=1655232 RepID=A0ABV7RI94_9NEIS
MARPQPEVLAAMVQEVSQHRLHTQLGAALFAPENWHQSLSGPYRDEPGRYEQLLQAGSRIAANCCVLTLNRISSLPATARGIHWAFRARGQPQGFRELLRAVRTALSAAGVNEEHAHSPHVTISYRAPMPLSTRVITPIDWSIDEVQLVLAGDSQPYHYRTLERWPLATPGYPYAQLRLL